MTQAEKQAKMDALYARRDEYETALDAIAKVERMMDERGCMPVELLDLDGEFVDKCADVCSEIYDLERVWTDEDNDIEQYATEQDIHI